MHDHCGTQSEDVSEELRGLQSAYQINVLNNAGLVVQGCEHILQSDVISLAQRLHKAQKRGVRVGSSARCGITGAQIIGSGGSFVVRPREDIVVMFGVRRHV